MARIFGVGHCVMDQLMLVKNHPVADSKNMALARAECVGGPVPSALVAAARMGSECIFAGQVGDELQRRH